MSTTVTVHTGDGPPLTVEVSDMASFLDNGADYPEGSLAIQFTPSGTIHYLRHRRGPFVFVRKTIGRVG